jgi:transposase
MTPVVIQFIQQCLLEDAQESNKKQHHTAKRIYDRLVDEMHFTGCESSIRAAVHKLRGNLVECYVPLEFDPGDAMQIDWGECYIYLNGKRTKVNLFCARLCYSCAPFSICYRKQNMEAFLEGIMHAFDFFGGVPRRVIFDNAKVAVKSGYGKDAVSQEKYAALAAHYCFETIFCNPASGNEKGLVENLVGWTRRNIFVPLPHAKSLDALNLLVEQNCCRYIDSHKVQSRPAMVKEMLQLDREKLLMLPGRRYDASCTMECRVSPYATIRFATNNYSVPLLHSGQAVAVKGFAETVCIYADGTKIAEHIRSYERNKDILSSRSFHKPENKY